MKTTDLGDLSGPLLVFGGVYSNLQALQALIAEAKGRGIAAKNMICTGDIVAYCADAETCVQLVRAAGCVVLMGNCEQQLASGAADCGCGFEEGTACDVLSAGWFAHAQKTVSAESCRWMAGLPDRIIFTHAGQRYGVIHGGVTNISKFIWSTDDDTVFDAEFPPETDVILAGHSGIAFIKPLGAKQWINGGAIGMPPNDGQPETRFVIIENGTPTIHTLNYDHKTASQRMVDIGLTQGYHVALNTGIWPSEDVLPNALRR
ncbi:MAG: metallophosphoesterase family protein [Rhodobacteraceae bacterium]|nr:metallophosphoesterase family protein [Paracoccaceae bacterium]